MSDVGRRLDSPEKLRAALQSVFVNGDGLDAMNAYWVVSALPETHIPLSAHWYQDNGPQGALPTDVVGDPGTFWLLRETIRAAGNCGFTLLDDLLCVPTECGGFLELHARVGRERKTVHFVDWSTLTVDRVNHYHHYFIRPTGRPGEVSYIPNQAYGQSDRRLVCSLEKFLTRFYSNSLTPDEIRDVGAAFKADGSTDNVVIGSSPEHWEKAFRTDDYSPGSCMTHRPEYYHSLLHPTTVYADNTSGIKIAYIIDAENDQYVLARSVLYEAASDDKRYIRVFGHPSLEHKLRKMGYVHGNLAGATLPIVPCETMMPGGTKEVVSETYVVPYLDDTTGMGAQSVAKFNGEWIIGSPGNPPEAAVDAKLVWLPATRPMGLVGRYADTRCWLTSRPSDGGDSDGDEDRDEYDSECDACGDAAYSANLQFTGEYHEHNICEYCYRHQYVRAYMWGDNQLISIDEANFVTAPNGRRYADINDNLENEGLGRLHGLHYQVEYAGELDDLIECAEGSVLNPASPTFIRIADAVPVFGMRVEDMTYGVHRDDVYESQGRFYPYEVPVRLWRALRVIPNENNWFTAVIKPRCQLTFAEERDYEHVISITEYLVSLYRPRDSASAVIASLHPDEANTHDIFIKEVVTKFARSEYRFTAPDGAVIPFDDRWFAFPLFSSWKYDLQHTNASELPRPRFGLGRTRDKRPDEITSILLEQFIHAA